MKGTRESGTMKAVLLLCLALTTGILAQISPEEGELFEGDIELTPEQREAIEFASRNKFAALKSRLWLTNGKAETIQYYIDPKIVGATNVIKQAIDDYHRKTCIRFKRVYQKPSWKPHIHFTHGLGCSSPVGKLNYGNTIRLAPGCWIKGKVMHEIGHSLGFFHEQSRPDRDNYVDILWENVTPGHEINFKKQTFDTVDSRGFPYDYDSMMHYGGKYFTVSWDKYTIKTKRPQDQHRIGQRKGFSTIDEAQLRAMYFC